MIVCVSILTLENIFLFIHCSNFEQNKSDKHLHNQYDYHNKVFMMHSAIKSNSENRKH